MVEAANILASYVSVSAHGRTLRPRSLFSQFVQQATTQDCKADGIQGQRAGRGKTATATRQRHLPAASVC